MAASPTMDFGLSMWSWGDSRFSPTAACMVSRTALSTFFDLSAVHGPRLASQSCLSAGLLAS
jgi:hypothetical protein